MAKNVKTKRRLSLRLAENQLEIEKTLALRYDVFNLEMNEGLAQSRDTGKDRDDYDLFCDHLIVVDDERDGLICGTYRLLRSSVASTNIGFYSENEFDLSPVYALPNECAEIGRSCVHGDYRDGSVISLLWNGLAAYMRQFEVQHLMGCASLHTTDPEEASRVYGWFREKQAIASDISVMPLESHRLSGFTTDYGIQDVKAVGKTIPPLIKGYLRAGTKVCGHPALDEEFGTVDFFVLFNRNDIEQRYGKHFNL